MENNLANSNSGTTSSASFSNQEGSSITDFCDLLYKDYKASDFASENNSREPSLALSRISNASNPNVSLSINLSTNLSSNKSSEEFMKVFNQFMHEQSLKSIEDAIPEFSSAKEKIMEALIDTNCQKYEENPQHFKSKKLSKEHMKSYHTINKSINILLKEEGHI